MLLFPFLPPLPPSSSGTGTEVNDSASTDAHDISGELFSQALLDLSFSFVVLGFFPLLVLPCLLHFCFRPPISPIVCFPLLFIFSYQGRVEFGIFFALFP